MSLAFVSETVGRGAPAAAGRSRGEYKPNPGLAYLIRSDAARWAAPDRYIDPDTVTLRQMAWAYYRYFGFRAAVWYRIAHWCWQKGIRGVPQLLQSRSQRRYGIEITVASPIGPGLYIAHTVGSVLAPTAVGSYCTVISNVTIGMRNEWAFPMLGDHVFLGAGARVLGGITLGDDCVVGANAVVVKDVAPGTTVVGVPAKPVGGRKAGQEGAAS